MEKIVVFLDLGGVLILWDRNKTTQKDLWASERVNKELLNYLLSKRETYRYIVLTNNDVGVEERLVDKYHIPGFYEGIVSSGSAGVAKPDERIFHQALSIGGVAPERCIFIDDDSLNVRAASKIGIHGIVYVDVSQACRDLERITSSMTK